MTDRPRNQGVQQLRAVAMLAVTIEHLLHTLPMRLGWFDHMALAAVYVFFAISGFVMMKVIDENFRKDTTSFLGMEANWDCLKVYAARRFWRIAPVALIGIAMLPPLYVIYKISFTDYAILILTFFTATMDIYSAFHVLDFNPFGFWSLSGEEKLYFLLVFLAVLLGARQKIVLAGAICIAMSLIFVPAMYLSVSDPILRTFSTYFSPLNFARDFFAGALVYLAIKTPAVDMALKRLLTLDYRANFVAFVIALAALSIAPFGYALITLMSCFLLYRAAHGVDLARSHWMRAVLSYFGDRSYTIYICHLPIMYVTFTLLDRINVSRIIGSAVVLVLTVLWCEIVFRYVENPLMQWSRRRFRYERSGGRLSVGADEVALQETHGSRA